MIDSKRMKYTRVWIRKEIFSKFQSIFFFDITLFIFIAILVLSSVRISYQTTATPSNSQVVSVSKKDIIASATDKPALSLSDAIYADLAIRHELDNVSIDYTDGKNANDVTLNETKHWLPASTVKTFAAMYAYKRIAEGNLDLGYYVTIDAKNDVPTELVTNDLPTLMEGDSVTIERLIRQMITQSDNTAYNQLLDILGRDNITSYIVSLGLTHSHVGSKLNLDTSQEQSEFDTPGYGINTTTAQDYALAFELIKDTKIPGAKQLYAVLKDQRINTMIPLYLPRDVICAHKTGDLDPLFHDGGICQDKMRTYVLTIFTNAGDPNLVAHLSQLIYTKNYDLVGQSTDKAKLSEIPEEHPLDPLVYTQPTTAVLGASTASIPGPDITAADLGVTSKDLSLVINNVDLPKVLIPADSPFHFLSDTWQFVKKGTALGAQANLTATLDATRLRLAEAKDLFARGKTNEAQMLLQQVQTSLTTVAKDQSLTHNSSAQNTIQAISETRFSMLGDGLQKTSGTDRINLIKSIAAQAKSTIQTVQPYIPDAINAINPAQKPLIGEVISNTPTTVTVKTAGGIDVTIHKNDSSSITIQEKKGTSIPLSETNQIATNSPQVTSSKTLDSLAVGSTIALIGSTTNNTFAPSLVLTNLPKELSAPEPVVVAKIDTKHNTMVVVENGVYTQVNINSLTTIKGSDTSIALTSIKPGDVVVVHGQPLTPTILTTPKVSPQTTHTPIISLTKLPIPMTPTPKLTSILQQISISPSGTKLGVITTSGPTVMPTSKPTITQSTSIPPALPSPTIKIIQSTSIQVVEKKSDFTSPKPTVAPKVITTQPTTPIQIKIPTPVAAKPTSVPTLPTTTTPTTESKK